LAGGNELRASVKECDGWTSHSLSYVDKDTTAVSAFESKSCVKPHHSKPSDLQQLVRAVASTAMKLLMAYVTWFAMAAVLAAGIVLAVKGSIWLLALGFLGFLLAFAKFGCLDGH
jgi:hypothetical protein